jgi:hypothetical protein
VKSANVKGRPRRASKHATQRNSPMPSGREPCNFIPAFFQTRSRTPHVCRIPFLTGETSAPQSLQGHTIARELKRFARSRMANSRSPAHQSLCPPVRAQNSSRAIAITSPKASGAANCNGTFSDARHWSATSWPPKSTAHHTGAKRLYSTVSEPAVDTNPAQHHLSSFASQFVGIAFMGRRRRGAYDFGR